MKALFVRVAAVGFSVSLAGGYLYYRAASARPAARGAAAAVAEAQPAATSANAQNVVSSGSMYGTLGTWAIADTSPATQAAPFQSLVITTAPANRALIMSSSKSSAIFVPQDIQPAITPPAVDADFVEPGQLKPRPAQSQPAASQPATRDAAHQ